LKLSTANRYELSAASSASSSVGSGASGGRGAGCPPRGKDDGALDGILQLPHVPRPVIPAEEGQRGRGDRRGRPLELGAYFATKCAAKSSMSSLRARERGRHRLTTFRR